MKDKLAASVILFKIIMSFKQVRLTLVTLYLIITISRVSTQNLDEYRKNLKFLVFQQSDINFMTLNNEGKVLTNNSSMESFGCSKTANSKFV